MTDTNRLALICVSAFTLAALRSSHAAEAEKVTTARARLQQQVAAAEYALTPDVENAFLEFARAA